MRKNTLIVTVLAVRFLAVGQASGLGGWDFGRKGPEEGVRFWEDNFRQLGEEGAGAADDIIFVGLQDERHRAEKQRSEANTVNQQKKEREERDRNEALQKLEWEWGSRGRGRVRGRGSLGRTGAGRRDAAQMAQKPSWMAGVDAPEIPAPAPRHPPPFDLRGSRQHLQRGTRPHGGRGHLQRGGQRRGSGQQFVAAARSWDKHTEELNRKSAEDAKLQKENELRIKMNTVIDAKGTTWGELVKMREASRRPRIDPTNPFAPTRKYLNSTESRMLLPDQGNEERELGFFTEELDEGEDLIEGHKLRTPWYCPFCDVSVTNDDAYLSHINGKRHQKTMGYSMKYKDETVDEMVGGIERGVKTRRLEREEKERRLARGESVSGEESWLTSSSDEIRSGLSRSGQHIGNREFLRNPELLGRRKRKKDTSASSDGSQPDSSEHSN